MSELDGSLLAISPNTRRLTTLLASGWGLFSAYIFFQSLLITHDTRLCCVGLVPLVVVWATLERKRWGRLALLGLSATTLGIFTVVVAYLASFGVRIHPSPSSIASDARLALHIFTNSPNLALIVLALSMATGLWLCRREVIAEFNHGKRKNLAIAQHVIAFCLVGCWGLTVALVPLTSAAKGPIPAPLIPPVATSTLHGIPYAGSRFGI
jgi:hypothetical protein